MRLFPGFTLELIKESAATAAKTDPAKWEAAKREARSKMGGKHSARAMQLATNIYKKKGGGYSGAKPTSQNNSLKKWSKQKWGYSGKDKPGQGGSGVYLPEKKRQRLKSTAEGRKRLRSASAAKAKATRKGEQYSSHGLAAGTSLKKADFLPEFLAKPRRDGFIDPRHDDFSKNPATGKTYDPERIERTRRWAQKMRSGNSSAQDELNRQVQEDLGEYSLKTAAAMIKLAHRCRKDILKALQSSPLDLQGVVALTPDQPKHEVVKELKKMKREGLISDADGMISLAKKGTYSSAKEAAASKDPRLERAGVSGYNQAKRTPGHPTKSHIVVAKEGDKVKTIRFGQQGVKTNQTAGQREAFKSRHRKNISRGRMSAAYWADKAKWSAKKTKDKDNPKWVKGS